MSKNPQIKDPSDPNDLLYTNSFVSDFQYDYSNHSQNEIRNHQYKEYYQTKQKDKILENQTKRAKRDRKNNRNFEDLMLTNPFQVDDELNEDGLTESDESHSNGFSGSNPFQSNSLAAFVRNGNDSERNFKIIKTIINIDSQNRDKTLWPLPNEFEFYFHKAFKNIKSIRLISTEIPNTQHTISEYPSDKQNNKIIWQNLEDSYGNIFAVFLHSLNVSTSIDPNDQSTHSWMILEFYVQSRNYRDLRDSTTNDATTILIKNVVLQDSNGNKTNLRDLTGTHEYEVYKLTQIYTQWETFQVKVFTTMDISAFSDKAIGQIVATSDMPKTVRDNLDYTLFCSENSLNCKNKILATSGQFYNIISQNAVYRRNYEVYIDSGNYLTKSLGTAMSEACKIMTVNDDYNDLTFTLDADKDQTKIVSRKKSKLFPEFALVNKYTAYSDASPLEEKQFIYDYMIIRVPFHGLITGDLLEFETFVVPSSGIPVDVTSKKHTIYQLTMYKGSDNDYYLKVFGDDSVQIPRIKVSTLDSGGYLTPFQLHYFLIRTDAYVANDTYGFSSGAIIPGIGSGDAKIWVERPFKFLWESPYTIGPKIGFKRYDSFENVSKLITEISDYYHDSYYTQRQSIKMSRGIRITMEHHKFQTGDIVEFGQTNCSPSLDNYGYEINVINNETIWIDPHKNQDAPIFSYFFTKLRKSFRFLTNIPSPIVIDPANTTLQMIRNGNNIGTITNETGTMGAYIVSISENVASNIYPHTDFDVSTCIVLEVFEGHSFDTNDIVLITGTTTTPSLDGAWIIEVASITKLIIRPESNYGNLTADQEAIIRPYFNLWNWEFGTLPQLYKTKNSVKFYRYLEYIICDYGVEYRYNFFNLKENGNYGFANHNPISKVNDNTIQIRMYNHSLETGDDIHIHGLINDSKALDDPWEKHYIVTYVDKNNFTITDNDLKFPDVNNLNYVGISSKYHGFQSIIKNLNPYREIQQIISLDGDLYLFLVNDKFDAIMNTGDLKKILAKLKLTGPPGTILYDSFLTNPVIFHDTPYPELYSMKFKFVHPDGTLVDFHNLDVSFTLEITEYHDQVPNTGISSRRGVADRTSAPTF